MKKSEKLIAVIKFSILILIVAGIPVLVYFRFPELIEFLKDSEKLNLFLSAHKTMGIFIYIGLQALQVIVAVVPGQIINLAGGYVFGILPGTLFSVIGICIGTVVSFYIARLLGKSAVRTLVGERKTERFVGALNSKKAYIVLFIIFLIPGLPKDVVSYAAGISEMRLQNFLFIGLLGRLPAMMITISVGKMFKTGDYIWVGVICVLILALCIAVFFMRKKIMKHLFNLSG